MHSKFTRAVIIHGWDGSPEGNWFPWLKSALEERGIATQVPAMPHPHQPEIEPWVRTLAECVGTPAPDLVLIGHSMGCQTILRYLETLPENQSVGAVLLVAGFFQLSGLTTDTERAIAQPWLVTPMDFEKIRTRTQFITAILSDNDPYVPHEENRREFEGKLGASVVIVKQQGHINGEAGITQLPIILDVIADLERKI